MIFYKHKRFEILPQVYKPCDDSLMLADNMTVKEGDRILDVGTGCDILGILASDFGEVVVSDINPGAVECALHNAGLNSAEVTCIQSDLFEHIEDRFDLIMFNPPYLPSNPEDENDLLKMAWDGGEDGGDVLDRFIQQVKKLLTRRGRVQIVHSSRSVTEKTLREFKKVGLKPEITAEQQHFFETLYVITSRA